VTLCSMFQIYGVFFFPEDGRLGYYLKSRQISAKLHGFTPQKTALFIVTAVRTWHSCTVRRT